MHDFDSQEPTWHTAFAKLLFPYQFRESQEEVLTQLDNEPYVLWQAPTGFGKTMLAMCSMLPYLLNPDYPLKRMLIFVRTKTQIYHIMQELAKINNAITNHQSKFNTLLNLGEDFKFPNLLALPLIGKVELCVHEEVKNRDNQQEPVASINCRAIRCPKINIQYTDAVLTEVKKHLQSQTNRITSSQALCDLILEVEETSSDCPYYVTKHLIQQTQIIVTTQSRLLDAKLRLQFTELFLSNLAETGIIIDEIHNFKPAKTLTFPLQNLETLVEFSQNSANNWDLNSEPYLQTLLKKFQENDLEITNHFFPTSQELYHVLQILDQDHYLVGRHVKRHKKLIRRCLRDVMVLLRSIGDSWYKIEKNINRLITRPEVYFKDLKQAKRMLLMSGTLFPINIYREYFGLEDQFEMLITKNTRPNELKLLFQHPKLTSKYSNRDLLYFFILARICLDLHKTNPQHTVVFTTSKDFSQHLFGALQRLLKDIPDKNIPIFKEQDSAYNQQLLLQLQQVQHCILIANLRGSLSEGIEIRDLVSKKSKITLIVLAGMPYTPPDPEHLLLVRLYQHYYNNPRAGQVFLEYLPMIQRLQQAIGRGVRSETDQCAVVCLDYRLLKLYFWNDIQPIKDFNELQKRLQLFYNKL